MSSLFYSPADKLAAVERELKMRRRVYPRWVANGRMTQTRASDVMEAIADDYRALERKERLL